jgi:hypothetical protein
MRLVVTYRVKHGKIHAILKVVKLRIVGIKNYHQVEMKVLFTCSWPVDDPHFDVESIMKEDTELGVHLRKRVLQLVKRGK